MFTHYIIMASAYSIGKRIVLDYCLDEIKKEILAKLPKDTQVTKVEFEGPEVVVYTKNPEIITENGDLIRSLAKELRKRIIIE